MWPEKSAAEVVDPQHQRYMERKARLEASYYHLRSDEIDNAEIRAHVQGISSDQRLQELKEYTPSVDLGLWRRTAAGLTDAAGHTVEDNFVYPDLTRIKVLTVRHILPRYA